jgi:Putative zinc-finger
LDPTFQSKKRETIPKHGPPFSVDVRKKAVVMDHNEATHLMAVERYLLDDLPPELRDDFEEHLFDCPECAMDLRSGAAFVDAAREHLPTMVASTPSIGSPSPISVPATRKKNWFLSLQAAWAVPAFAALLAVVGYQNVSTIPHLRAEADQPRLVPWTSLHVGTRGGDATMIQLSHEQGTILLIDMPPDSGYTSYAFDLLSPEGKVIWTRNEAAPNASSPGAGTLSLLIPGSGLKQGAYTLVITGMRADGGRTPIDRRTLDLHFTD